MIKDFIIQRKMVSRIKHKLGGMVLLIILLMSFQIFFLAFNSLKYNKQYEKIIDNINKVNTISENVVKINKELMDVEFGSKKMQDATYRKTVNDIRNDANSILKEGGDKETQIGIYQISKLMDAIDKSIDLTEDSLKQNKKAEMIKNSQSVGDIAGFVKVYSEQYILNEVKNSEKVKLQIKEDFNRAIIVNGVLFILILVVSIFNSWRLSKSIVEPIKELKDKANSVASNDLSVDRVEVSTKDELMELANAFNSMFNNLREMVSKLTESSVKLQGGALELSNSSSQNSAVAEEISATSQLMVKSINLQNDKVENTMNELESMIKSSNKINISSDKILKSANEASLSVNDGNGCINEFVQQLEIIKESVGDTSNITEKINSHAREMNEIINVITHIASQTNFLALNAAIEAARAGEKGKGFAVVSEQIGKLAKESEESSKKIGLLVKDFQTGANLINTKMIESLDQVIKGSEIAEKTRESFTKIKQTNEIINNDTNEISQEIKDLNLKIKAVNMRMNDVSNISSENSKSVLDISAAIENQADNLLSVSNFSTELFQLSESLNSIINKFKL